MERNLEKWRQGVQPIRYVFRIAYSVFHPGKKILTLTTLDYA